MGKPMALNLITTGHNVSVWNRSTGKTSELEAAGAKVYDSKKEIVANCDILFACVSDPSAAKDLVFGDDGLVNHMDSSKAFVDMSTVDEYTVKEINQAIKAQGGRYLEAPVSGSKVPAEQGTLLIMCAGDEDLFKECQTCFDAMGKESYYLGDVGAGARMKLVVNAIMGAQMAALAEGLQLAKQSDLDVNVLHDVLCKGAMNSPLVQGKGKAVINSNFATNFPLKHQQKDLRLALKLSEDVKQPIPTIAAANELYKTAMARDLGDSDMCAVSEALKN